MWWLFTLGLFGVLGIADRILKNLKKKAFKERKRWENEHKKVEKEILNYEKKIQDKIRKAQSRANFEQLTQLHFESMKVANHAYRLLKDARTALDAIGEAIKTAGIEKNRLIAEKRATHNAHERTQIEQEISALIDLREKLFPDKDELKAQRNHFNNRVKDFNANTRTLKLTIRDKCGNRGRDWYQRLEARTASRRRSG
ncbi:hypothetical protein D0962_37565 [Leptolyngbyaceae cyanobacterium CCMR0082]|uniref:Uncharacterized protein n=1 Tax=Adonisia turfae CCMR0082 TaxID=2304604 RepID=A0A6M0SKI1_9CYAN|nr:hypothetical protein [Adonisia turfae]NEZ68371.1 hypothetical protein [Adonisia turfae CCMR0082]